MALEGITNLYVATDKATVAATLALATPESGPGAVATGAGATLATISSLSSGLTGATR